MRIYSLLCALVVPLGAMEPSPRQIDLSKLNDSALQKVGSGAPVAIQEVKLEHDLIAVADSTDTALHKGISDDYRSAYSLHPLHADDAAHWFFLLEDAEFALSPDGRWTVILTHDGFFIARKEDLDTLATTGNALGTFIKTDLPGMASVLWLSNTRFAGCAPDGIAVVDFPEESSEIGPVIRHFMHNHQAKFPISRLVPISENMVLWSRSGSSLGKIHITDDSFEYNEQPFTQAIPGDAVLATHQSGLIAWVNRGTRLIRLGCFAQKADLSHEISPTALTAQEGVHAFVFSPCGTMLAVATGASDVNSLQIRGIILPNLKTYPIGKIALKEAPFLKAVKLWWSSYGDKSLMLSGKDKKSNTWLLTATISPLAVACAHEQYKRKQSTNNNNVNA